MDPSSVKEFYGVPVLVQLRIPIVQVMVDKRGRGKLPYTDEPEKSQWAPMPHMESGGPIASQIIALAVIYPLVDGSPTVVEMRWSSVPAEPEPGSGALVGIVATLASIIDTRDIAAITRVMSVPDTTPSLILRA